MTILLTVLFIFVCILVVLIVLLQPSQGEGLGSAFGGGISESFFGTRAMTWLARATIVLVVVFLLLAVGLNKLQGPSVRAAGSGSLLEGESRAAEPPPGASAPSPVAPSVAPSVAAPAASTAPAVPAAAPATPPPSAPAAPAPAAEAPATPPATPAPSPAPPAGQQSP